MSDPGGGAEQRDRLVNLLIDSVVSYAIFVLDAGGVVRTWNPGAERLKGYSRDEIVGQHFSVFYTPEDRAEGLPQEMLRLAAADGRVERRGWRVRADGSRFWGDVTITALRDDDGELVGFAKVTRDLTEEHEVEVARARALERERQAAQELAELDEMRSRLLAGISHDLTTPIAAIRGVVDLLTSGDVEDDERDEFLALIARNAEQLNHLTEQLSELSRLQRGRLELDPQTLDLRETAESCVKDLGPLLDGLTLEIEIEGAVEADRLALRRVLTNLITNAARHSPDGGCIRIVSDERDDRIAVGVADQGPGVVRDDQHRIFDEFARGSASPRRRGHTMGTALGLGLSIVRLYVEQHGGTVWVDSEEGDGATFWFTLPAA